MITMLEVAKEEQHSVASVVQKKDFEDFLSSQYVGGLCERASWRVNGKGTLTAQLESTNSKLRTSVRLHGTGLGRCHTGIHNLKELRAWVKQLDGYLLITLEGLKMTHFSFGGGLGTEIFGGELTIAGGLGSATFETNALDIRPPRIKYIPDFEMKVQVNEKVIRSIRDAYRKAKAQGPVKFFVLEEEKESPRIVFCDEEGKEVPGTAKTLGEVKLERAENVSIAREARSRSRSPWFEMTYVEKVLKENRDADGGELAISYEGLLRLRIKKRKVRASYYLLHS